MKYENILTQIQNKIGIVTLHRPQALNALNAQLITEMNHALSGFDADPTIHVIILTGSEKAFAAGADIREMKDKTVDEVRAENYLWDWDKITTISKPIIAAVSGYALGGGCEFAMASDFIIASDTAKFGLPEISLGIIPGGGGTQRLTRAIGKSKAFEMMLTGRMLDASEAERLGIVTRVVAVDQLMAETIKTAEKIAELSLPSVIALKKAVRAADEKPLSEGLKIERDLFHACFAHVDQREGMTAFLEKRKPNFKS